MEWGAGAAPNSTIIPFLAKRGKYALISWFAETVTKMILHFPAFAFTDSGSVETTKWWAPFCLAICSLFALVEIATT